MDYNSKARLIPPAPASRLGVGRCTRFRLAAVDRLVGVDGLAGEHQAADFGGATGHRSLRRVVFTRY